MSNSEFIIVKHALEGKELYLDVGCKTWSKEFNSNTHLMPTRKAAIAVIEYHDLGCSCEVRGRTKPVTSKAHKNIKQLCDMVNTLAGFQKVRYEDFIEGIS